MNKKLIVAVVGLAGAIGLTSVASAADATLYGSIRAGAIYHDPDVAGQDETWDLGATGVDGGNGGQGFYSRLGVRGSQDLGNGMSAGFHIERAIDGDSLSTRHTNVYLDGILGGKLTLGQQDNPFRKAAHWDQTWFFGGQIRGRDSDGGSRLEGISYSMSNGPFSFDLAFTGNDGRDGAATDTPRGAVNALETEDTVDETIAVASYDFGLAKVSLGFNDRAADERSDLIVLGLNGSIGDFGWYVAYQQNEDNRTRTYRDTDGTNPAGPVATGETDDQDILGVFLSYAVNERNLLYLQYEDLSADVDYNVAVADGTTGNSLLNDFAFGNPGDSDALVLGYSRSIGPSTTFIAEYLKTGSDDSDADPQTLGLALKVDF